MPKTISPEIRRAIERNAMKPWSAPEMRGRLEEAVATGRLKGPIPSLRTVFDVLARTRSTPFKERLSSLEISWPNSFDEDIGALTWSAAPSYFELLDHLHGRHPLYPLALWFWRITQSAPDAPVRTRHYIAAVLALSDRHQASLAPEIEAFLTAAPWRLPLGDESNPSLRRLIAWLDTLVVDSNDSVSALEIAFGVYSFDPFKSKEDAEQEYFNHIQRVMREPSEYSREILSELLGSLIQGATQGQVSSAKGRTDKAT
jgi:hypothetical protein